MLNTLTSSRDALEFLAGSAPDFAILDVSAPPDARAPGRVVEAGFFDEQWRTQPRSD